MNLILKQLNLEHDTVQKVGAIVASLLLVAGMVWYVGYGRDQYFTVKQQSPVAPAIASTEPESGEVLGTTATENQPETSQEYKNPLNGVYVNPFK